MLKSEYDRNFQWVSKNDINYNYMKKKQTTEPLMAHKKRVKEPEDNVLIGAPLPSQKSPDTVAEKQDPYYMLGKKNERFSNSQLYRAKSLGRSYQEPENQRHHHHHHHHHHRRRSLSRSPERRYNSKEKIQRPIKKSKISEGVQTVELSDKSIQVNDDKICDYRINRKMKKDNQNKIQKQSKRVESPKAKEVKLERPIKSASNIRDISTEYRRNYEPKHMFKGIKEEPMTDRVAENRSKLDTKLKIYSNFISEYQRQFKPYEYVTETQYRKMRPSTGEIGPIQKAGAQSTELQFIPELKPKRALTPPPNMKLNLEPNENTDRDNSRNEMANSDFNIKKVKNPHQLYFPHGTFSEFRTEYSENFDNKWTKLDLELSKQQQTDIETGRSDQHSKWFREILELRKKAKEYRQRSRGTHLSREHLGQVYTKSNRNKDINDNDDYDDSREQQQQQQQQLHKRSMSNRSPGKECGCDSCSFISESICSSYSTVTQSKVMDPRQGWSSRGSPVAGKPSYDNNLLLDEIASHDTDIKSTNDQYNEIDSVYSDEDLEQEQKKIPYQYQDRGRRLANRNNYRTLQPTQMKSSPNPENKYTFQKYFNPQKRIDLKTVPKLTYDEIERDSDAQSLTTKSVVSSSTMSLAKETLERARRNRDEVLRQKG